MYPDGDSRLLNLELAEYGYAYVKSADGTQYSKYFTDAIFDISIKKLRIYGEVDKDYDYSTEAKEMSIKQIRETYGTEEAIDASRNGFTSPLIKVSGVVVRKMVKQMLISNNMMKLQENIMVYMCMVVIIPFLN